MSPLSTLLARIPLGSAPSAAPEPPLVDPATFSTWMDELGGGRSGLPWALGGGVARALGERLSSGERPAQGEPAGELDQLLDTEAVDAFAGRVAGPPGRTPSERMLQVAAWARASSEVLLARHRQGHQSLVSEQRIEGRLTAVPLPTGEAAPHVAILDGENLWIAESPAGRPLTDIAMDIGWALSLRKFQPIHSLGKVEVAAVVPLDRRTIQDARHSHRTAGLTGPWLSVATGNRTHQAPPLELVSASRLRLDVGELAATMRRLHVLADQLLASEDDEAPRTIARDLTRRYGDLWRPRVSWRRPPRTEGREEYVAVTRPANEAPEGGLDVYAYRLALALEQGPDGESTPAVLLPQGARRILTSVRRPGGVPEDFGSWNARLELQRSRERDGYGLRSEWERRLARQPIPPAAHRRLLLAIRQAARLDGPSSLLTGAAQLHYSELTPRRDAPFAVFSGATPPGTDRRSAVWVSVHRVGEELHIVLTARGHYAERSRAAALLDRILD